tara:strand:+ start:310 stop:561 length:252 start_codon:yes stop_codon:yes gene_type:complete
MKNLMDNLQKYLAVIGVIGAVGGGFWSFAVATSEINNRLDNLEAVEITSVDVSPLETKIAILEEKVSKLEKATDNSRNPLLGG